MYLDQLKETEQVLSEYNTRQKNIQKSDTLLASLAGINGAVQEITDQMQLSAVAKEELVPDAGLDREKAEELLGQLNQLQSDLGDGNDVGEGSKSLQAAAKDFKETENKKWRDAVESRASTQSSLLQQLKNFTEDPLASSSIVTVLKANQAQMPKSGTSIREYGKVLHNAETIVKKVGGTPGIMGFIQKVTAGQAVLSDLNDEVKTWIEEHHLEKKLRITL